MVFITSLTLCEELSVQSGVLFLFLLIFNRQEVLWLLPDSTESITLALGITGMQVKNIKMFAKETLRFKITFPTVA